MGTYYRGLIVTTNQIIKYKIYIFIGENNPMVPVRNLLSGLPVLLILTDLVVSEDSIVSRQVPNWKRAPVFTN